MSLNSLINILGKYNFFLDGHPSRVFFYSSLMVKKIPLPPEEKELITAAAYLHDIGKVFTESKVLHKNGTLNEDERTLVRRHTLDSVLLLSHFGFDQDLIKMVLLHHERVDGQGYPLGLKDEEIPLGAKIIAIADAFDSLTSWRPYRNPLSIKEAQKELIRYLNTQFDSFLLTVFFKSLGRAFTKKTIISMRKNFPNLTMKHLSNLTKVVGLNQKDNFV
jgi:putative two-component system response regulator